MGKLSACSVCSRLLNFHCASSCTTFGNLHTIFIRSTLYSERITTQARPIHTKPSMSEKSTTKRAPLTHCKLFTGNWAGRVFISFIIKFYHCLSWAILNEWSLLETHFPIWTGSSSGVARYLDPYICSTSWNIPKDTRAPWIHPDKARKLASDIGRAESHLSRLSGQQPWWYVTSIPAVDIFEKFSENPPSQSSSTPRHSVDDALRLLQTLQTPIRNLLTEHGSLEVPLDYMDVMRSRQNQQLDDAHVMWAGPDLESESGKLLKMACGRFTNTMYLWTAFYAE